MHILHVTPYYAPAYAFGGVTRAVEGMARAAARRGHTVTVLTTDALTPSERCAEPPDTLRDGVRVLRARNLFRRGTLNLSTPFGMRRLLRDLSPDVIHCHEFRTVENLLIDSAAPLLLSPHGTLTYGTGRAAFKRAWDRLFGRRLARRFDTVIGLTEQEAAEARALWAAFGVTGMRFAVVPNGIELTEFEQLTGRAAFRARWRLGDAPTLLFMGRLHPRKGVAVLIQAFKAADVPGARLVIAGGDEGMLSVIAPLLDARITVTGYLGGADRLAAYAAADAFALPATGEGLSMAALEAMGAGLPVILSPGCSLPEAAAAGAGLIVPPEVEPLADAIRQVMTDPRDMGANGRRLVAARFTWEAVAAQLDMVYHAAAE
jgi:glycosyltransferase involved in cell wall biosynthesis